MRVRAVLGSILGSVTVLVIGWQAGAAAAHNAAELSTASSSGAATTPTGAATPGSTPTPAATSAATSTASPSPAAGSTSTGSSSTASRTIVGATEETPFGPMQAEIIVAGTRITNVKLLQETDMGGRSAEISNYAAPILRQEVLKAQSANVDTVGGATYSSQGYLASVQSAIDKAHL